jgi:hypothetical protein
VTDTVLCQVDAEIRADYCTCGTNTALRHEPFCGTDVGPCRTEHAADRDCPRRGKHLDVIEARQLAEQAAA